MVGKQQGFWSLICGYSFFIVFIFTELAIGSPSFINLQSRISKPNGDGYLEANDVQFRMTITDPLGTCILFQEDFANVDMTGSKGLINFKVGTGSKTYPAGPMAMPALFTNVNSPLFNCQAGGTYTAASSDSRKLVMQFNDGSGWQTVPSMEVNSVPFALESLTAQKLGSYPAADYVRTAQFTSCTGTEAVHFNGTNFTCVALSSGAPYSAITGATGTNTIDNTNHAQTWNWSTATTQNPMSMTANALTTGSLMNLTTSNNSLNSTNGILNVANTGTSTNGMVARIQSNSTAGSGLTVLANGNVGVGTTAPAALLDVELAAGTYVRTKMISGYPGLEVKYGAATGEWQMSAGWANWNDLSFFKNGSRTATMTSTGLLVTAGAGAPFTPVNKLDVNGGAAFGTYAGVNTAPSNGIIVSGNVGVGTTSPAVSLDIGSKTDGARMPNGTTAQRPTCDASVQGTIRFNSQTAFMEFCDGTSWYAMPKLQPASPPTTPAGSGYFVLTATTWDGNLGGRIGADSKCLTELATTYTNWSGYADANSRGLLIGAKVKAFICDITTCNNLTPLGTYIFSVANQPGAGGASFTVDGSGGGPNDSAVWSAANRFNGTANYWSGRAPGSVSVWSTGPWGGANATTFCSGWSGGTSGQVGDTGSSTNTRWQGAIPACGTSLPLICIVNP